MLTFFLRFDALAEEPRGEVLDNMFMGGTCNIKRPPTKLLYYRVPYNFQSFDIKVMWFIWALNHHLHVKKYTFVVVVTTTVVIHQGL